MTSPFYTENAKTNALTVIAVPQWLENQLKRQKLSIYDAADITVLNRILSKDDVVFYSLFVEYLSTFFMDTLVDADVKGNSVTNPIEPFIIFNPKLEFMDYATYSNNRAAYMAKWNDLDIREKLQSTGMSSSNGKGFLKATYGGGKIFITIVESDADNLILYSEFYKSLFDAVSRIWTITEVSCTKLFDRYFSDMKNEMLNYNP